MAREIQDHYFRQAKREGYLSRAAYKLIEIDDRKKILSPGARVLDCGSAPGSWLQVASQRIGPAGLVIGIDLKPITHQFPIDNVRTLVGDLRDLPTAMILPEAGPPEVAPPENTTSEAGPDEAAPPEVALPEGAPEKPGTSVGALPGAEEGPGRPHPRNHPRNHPRKCPRKRPGTPLFTVILSDTAPSTTGDHTIDHHQSVRLCQSLLDRCADLLAPGGRLVMKVFEGEAYPDLLARCRRLFDSAKGFRPKASRGESREMYIIARDYRGHAVEPSPVDIESPPRRRRPSPGWGSDEG